MSSIMDFQNVGGSSEMPRAGSPVSVAAEPGLTGGVGAGGHVGATGIFREEQKRAVLVGRVPRVPNPRLWHYDVLEGRKDSPSIEVTRDDRMSASQAGATMASLHEMFGVARELPRVLAAFDDAMLLCHALNGSSVLSPGRARFGVPGVTVECDFHEVVRKLGPDLRRFFRAYADETIRVLKKVLKNYDYNDLVSVEQVGQIRQIAATRGISRYPYLIADTAEAAVYLTQAELQAVLVSKGKVIGGTLNAADSMTYVKPQSYDVYDSTNHQRLRQPAVGADAV